MLIAGGRAKGFPDRPPLSRSAAQGNGGYVAGLLALEAGGSGCEVTLLKPPPLERDLSVAREGAQLTLRDGAETIASLVPAGADPGPIPAVPSLAEAEAASRRFAGFTEHSFPACFVCGPDRAEGDGLRIFPGETRDGLVAATWTATSELCSGDGKVRSEFLWAALDCPGYFAVQRTAGPAVLGRIAVHIAAGARCGEPLVLLGWPLGSAGRKHRAGTALYGGGSLKAYAAATWISIAPPFA